MTTPNRTKKAGKPISVIRYVCHWQDGSISGLSRIKRFAEWQCNGDPYCRVVRVRVTEIKPTRKGRTC